MNLAKCLDDFLINHRWYPLTRKQGRQLKNMYNIQDVIPLLPEEKINYLWNCQDSGLRISNLDVLFISRLPELITFAMLPTQSKESELTVIYPEPPIGIEEKQLIINVW